MQVHDMRDVLDVRGAVVTNSCFDDVNMSNTQFHNVNLANARVEDVNLSNTLFTDVNMSNVKNENAQIAGMEIKGVSVVDLFAAYKTAKDAGSN